jgi:hypothetical protein
LILAYAPNANGVATVTLRATDSGGLFVQVTLSVTVNPVNDAPVLLVHAGQPLDQGATETITAAMLASGDVDNTAAQLTYTLATLPQWGELSLDGVALGAGATFTQADIDAGRLTYQQVATTASASGGSDSFRFSVSDGAGGSTPQADFTITVGAAPVVPPPPPPPDDPTPTPDPISTPPASGGFSPPPSSSPSTDVDTTDNKDKTGGDGAGGRTGSGGTAIPGTGTSGGGGSGAPTNNQPAADAAAPVAKPDASREAEPVAKAPVALAPRDQITVAPVEVTPPPLPPAPPPVAVAPPAPPQPPAAPVAFIAQTDGVMSKQLDQLREQVTRETPTIRLVAGSATFASLGLSVLYILWTMRAGYMLASLLSSLPAWSFVDPLPILDQFGKTEDDEDNDDSTGSKKSKSAGDDDESLETLVKGRGGRPREGGAKS